MKYTKLYILLPLLLICGCATIKLPNNVTSIGSHPYQCAGYYELTGDNFVSRILINRYWVKNIKRDKYYVEITLKEPIGERKMMKEEGWIIRRPNEENQ